MNDDPELHILRLDRSGIRTVLGDLEAEIMELIWDRPAGQGTTVRDIFEILYERRKTAYTTVMNTMTRLAKKKLLRVEKVEQAYVYYPVDSEQQFLTQFAERVIQELLISFTGEPAAGLKKLSDEEAAARVRQLFADLAERRAQEES